MIPHFLFAWAFYLLYQAYASYKEQGCWDGVTRTLWLKRALVPSFISGLFAMYFWEVYCFLTIITLSLDAYKIHKGEL